MEPFETVRRCKDGRDIHVSVTISPIHDSRGQVTVSLRKRAEEAVAKAREATEETNRELEAFSYSVAHDVRAPLRGLDGFSLALLEDYADKLDEDGQRYLRRIRESAQYMAHIIESLLSLAQLARGDLRREPVDPDRVYRAFGPPAAAPRPVARAILERLRASQPAREVELHVGRA